MPVTFDDVIFLIYQYTASHLFLVPLGVIGIWRWSVWLFKEIVALKYRPEYNSYHAPVSIVTPVYNEDPVVFAKALISWAKNYPEEIIAVIDYTDEKCIDVFKKFQKWYPKSKLAVTKTPGKRASLAVGIRAAKEELVALVDSDTFWSDDLIKNILPPFIDPKVAGVGTYQSVWKPKTLAQKFFNIQLNLRYHDDFPFLAASGDALICLSGRTAFYRRKIILPLLDDLVNEKFMGKPVISGDDKRLTYLVLSKGFKVRFQSNAQVYTPGMPDLKSFMKQRLRWARNSLRADLKALREGWVFHHPALAFFQIDKTLRGFALILSPIYFIVSLVLGFYFAAAIIFVWWFVSRFIKLTPHFALRPRDITLLPFFVMFTFVSAVVNIFALFTLNTQGWITRWDTSRLLKLKFLQKVPAYAATASSLALLTSGVILYKQQFYFIPLAKQQELTAQMLINTPNQQIQSDIANKARISQENNLLVKRYVVQNGDSIAQIAAKEGIEPLDLLYANISRLPNWNKLETGFVLSIPGKDTHLKPQTNFNYQRIYADPRTITYDPQTNTIEIYGRGQEFSLSDIRAKFGDKYLQKLSSGEWYLKSKIYLHSGTALKLNKNEVSWLKMASNKNGYVYILAYNSILEMNGVKITSWDEHQNTYDQDLTDGRSFILAKDGSRMDFYNSEFAYLGFDRPENFPLSSYGVSWRMSNGRLGATLLTGEVTGSKFHHNYFGAFTFGATGMRWSGNEFYENIRYGLDPHDDSNGFLVENNIVRNNGSHGIIFSKRCTYNIIRNNLSYNNKGHGIMLHEKSDNNFIGGNTLYGNTDGIAIWNSGINIIRENNIYGNNKSGIRANANSAGNFVADNRIRDNKKNGIYLYDGAGSNIIQNNSLSHNRNALYVKTNANSIRSNKLEKNTVGIFLLGGAADNKLSDNRIAYNFSYGIYVKNPVDRRNFLGSNYIHRNVQDIVTKEATL